MQRSTDSPASDNHILARLPAPELALIARDLRPVWLAPEETIHEAGAETTEVIFPTTAVVSMVVAMRNGGTVEVNLAGREGVVGCWVAADIYQDPWQTVVQSPGNALVIEVSRFQRHVAASPALRQLVFRYCVIQQYAAAQTVGCNRFHDLASRTARWLLSIHDRVASDRLEVRQEFLAQMLGVYRPSVTVALAPLQLSGIISRPRRGYIEILDRPRLEARACECYFAMRDFAAEVLPESSVA